MKLTVGLHTANGRDALERCLSSLAGQQGTRDAEFLVVDDASCEPISDGLQACYPELDLRVIRTLAPVGGAMCMLRALENARGDWFWSPNPHDQFTAEALSTVLNLAQRADDSALVVLPGCAELNIAARGPAALFSNLERLETLCEPSQLLFRRTVAAENLHAAYRFAYCGSAHLALALCLLKLDMAFTLSSERIVETMGALGGSAEMASTLSPYLGLSTLLELPFDREARDFLRTRLQAMSRRGFSRETFERALEAAVQDRTHKQYVAKLRQAAAERFFGAPVPERQPAATCTATPSVGAPIRRPHDGRLTVGIPTYNRPEQIVRIVRQLLPQLTEHDVELLVIDNASENSVRELLEPAVSACPGARCRVVRNPSNIGANPNILRLLEHCETEYLWMLGDDDRLAEDAVGKICRTIQSYPDASFLNFASLNPTHPPRHETVECQGLNELLRKADGVGPLMFLSANVYRVDTMLPHMGTALSMLYSCAPQLAIALAAARGGAISLMSSEVVIDAISDGTPVALQSNGVYPAAGLATLLEMESDDEAQARLAALLFTTTRGWLTVKSVAYNLTMTAAATGNVDYSLTQFDATKRLFRLRSSIGTAIQLVAARWLIAHPRVSASLVKGAYKAIKRRARDLSQFSVEVSKRA